MYGTLVGNKFKHSLDERALFSASTLHSLKFFLLVGVALIFKVEHDSDSDENIPLTTLITTRCD